MPFDSMLCERSRSYQVDSHETLKSSRELAIEDLLRSFVSSKKEPLAVPARLSRKPNPATKRKPGGELVIMDKIADTNVEAVTEGVKKVEIDSSKLTALSQEVISRQATVSLTGVISDRVACHR
jgi:hypothetical protein